MSGEQGAGLLVGVFVVVVLVMAFTEVVSPPDDWRAYLLFAALVVVRWLIAAGCEAFLGSAFL